MTYYEFIRQCLLDDFMLNKLTQPQKEYLKQILKQIEQEEGE